MPVDCLLVDDHNLFRAGLVSLLGSDSRIRLVGQVATVEEGLGLPVEPDVVLLDLSLPPNALSKESAVVALRERWPRVGILVLTASEDRYDLIKMLSAGASGYVTKHAPIEELEEAVSAVARGNVFVTARLAAYLLEDDQKRSKDEWSLTLREEEVLRCLAEGDRDEDIAYRLGIAVKTVQSHLTRIRDKTGLRRRAELTRYAVREGLTDVAKDSRRPREVDNSGGR